ncbi:MAG: S8 family peptidase [Methermicoccaceae archaeon]
MSKLTPVAEKIAHRLPLVPVIVKAKQNKYCTVAEAIRSITGDFAFMKINFDQVATFREIPTFNMIEALLPREWVFDLGSAREVERVFPNKIMTILYPTVAEDAVYRWERGAFREKEPFTTTYYTKKLIGADVANQKGFDGTGVRVAVCDTGLTRRHPATRNMVLDSVMLQVHDENGHGMWTSACVGGKYAEDTRLGRRLGKKIPTEGMAPNAHVVGIKCLGYVVGTGSTGGILKAIEMAAHKYNADIISLSLGAPSEEEKPEDDPYYEPIKSLTEGGVIFSVSAGNSGPDEGTVSSPGVCPDALTIGAYDPITGKIADFSSRGPTNWGDLKPDCIAPGVNILAPITGWLDRAGDNMNNNYSPLSGTSMSCPHISGLLACMRQAHSQLLGKTLTTEEVKEMLRELGEPKNNERGHGMLTWSMYEEWLSTTYSIELR